MQPAQRYGTYDEFAWFYTRGWGTDYHAQAGPVFEEHVFPALPAAARVLDLCCGSGDLSRALVARGYRVTGIDGSEAMLEYARRQVREAEFLLEDARTFQYDAIFDAVLSTFDSLNHILNLEELTCVFANVYRALAAGGLFVFDLNMQESFETMWRGWFASVEDTAVGITRGSYDPVRKTGCAQVTLFRQDGAWQRYDVTVLEKCYSEEEVKQALEGVGFTDVRTHEAWELGMRGDIALGREFFFASKPSRPE